MFKKKLMISLIALILLAAAALIAFNFYKSPSAPAGTAGASALSAQSGQIKVVASFYPLYFFAQQIGGTQATVLNITPAGAEPHDYEPTAADMVAIQDSRLLILNGGLEPWGDSVRSNLDPQRTTVVAAGEGLTTKEMTEDGKNMVDPHIWLSPPLAEQMVDKITAGFVSVDPAHQDYYQANAVQLEKKLSDLDKEYAAGLQSCAQKDIITSHAAFAYLAEAYGLRQVPIAGLSPETEPSPSAMADIIQLAQAQQIKYVFFESLASPKLSDTIASEIGAKTLVLDPLEGLTPDAVAAGQDYFSVMRSNLTNLQTALECQK